MLSRTIMVESGLGGWFWFKSAVTGCEARNGTYKARIGTTPWKLMHGEKKDVSQFRAFGCRAWVNLKSERREKGKHTPRAIEAIHLGYEPNTSAYSFFIQERNTMMSSNQAQFDPKQRNDWKIPVGPSNYILFQTESDVEWIKYNPLHISNYTRVHFDVASDMMVMRVNTEVNTFTRITQIQWLQDKLALS